MRELISLPLTGAVLAEYPGGPRGRLKFSESYAHVLRIDTHSPWDSPEIAAVIRRIGPDYLVHDLSAASRAEREARVGVQRRALGLERK